MSSFPAFLAERIKKMRLKHPGWGPSTILAELQSTKELANCALPSRSTIGLFLQEQQLSKSYEINTPLPVEPCKEAKRCHSLWQVDGKGNSQVKGVGPISLLNVKDVYSSAYISCFPARMKSMQGHPNKSDYQTALRLGFINHGLPRALQSDHASVFYENVSKSPFPTMFCLWLISLGIQPCFSRVNQPTDQGKVEKAHQTVFDQVLRGRHDYKNWNHLFEWCRQRRIQLNEVIPSRGTDHLPPLKKYPRARHSGRFYHPTREALLIDLKKVFTFLAKGKWYRKIAGNQTVCLGGQIYYISGSKPRQQVQITFCSRKKCLLFQNDKELVIAELPIKGISREILMGNLEPIAHFPDFQLELPLDWDAQKLNTTLSDSA
jgi:transposase InsO family protein